jgi:hypothetical protein
MMPRGLFWIVATATADGLLYERLDQAFTWADGTQKREDALHCIERYEELLEGFEEKVFAAQAPDEAGRARHTEVPARRPLRLRCARGRRGARGGER